MFFIGAPKRYNTYSKTIGLHSCRLDLFLHRKYNFSLFSFLVFLILGVHYAMQIIAYHLKWEFYIFCQPLHYIIQWKSIKFKTIAFL